MQNEQRFSSSPNYIKCHSQRKLGVKTNPILRPQGDPQGDIEIEAKHSELK